MVSVIPISSNGKDGGAPMSEINDDAPTSRPALTTIDACQLGADALLAEVGVADGAAVLDR